MFTLAHLSDIHLGPLPKVRRRDLMSKRMLGYVNWHRGRKYVHRREILDLITRDIVEQAPDHIAVMKAEYQREGVERNNAYYGYVPKLASSSSSAADLTPAI